MRLLKSASSFCWDDVSWAPQEIVNGAPGIDHGRKALVVRLF